MNKIVILLVLSIFFVGTTGLASAGYVPPKYKEEAKNIKNDVQLYKFALKYQGQYWANDILRQLSQNYTNNGLLSQLPAAMKKYIK